MTKVEFLNNLYNDFTSGKINETTFNMMVSTLNSIVDTTTPPPTPQNTPTATVKPTATTVTITLYKTKNHSQNVLVFDNAIDSETSTKLRENFKYASKRGYWYPKYSENDFTNFGRNDHKEYYNKAMNDFVQWFNSRK